MPDPPKQAQGHRLANASGPRRQGGDGGDVIGLQGVAQSDKKAQGEDGKH